MDDYISDLVLSLSEQLLERKQYLATAESCTGGLVAAQLTAIPGSSNWFERGFITYSNQAKQDMLDVSAECLNTYGAVSEQTAVAMAEGVLQHSQADVSIAITGIAGPSGGSKDKPVGTVCFAWAEKGKATISEQQLFNGDRQTIREQAVRFALQKLLK